MTLLGPNTRHKLRYGSRRVWTNVSEWPRVLRREYFESSLEWRTNQKTCESVSKLPAELRSSILDEWLTANPPTINGKTGSLEHPLIEDGSRNLKGHAFHNVYHTTPLRVTERLETCKRPTPQEDQWLDKTPQFLGLHDHHCGKAARGHVKIAVRLEVFAHLKCSHRDVTFTARRNAEGDVRWYGVQGHHSPSSQTTCSGWCDHHTRAVFEKWCLLVIREGIPYENLTFEVVFLPTSRLKKHMRWAKKHPALVCRHVATYTCFGVILPIVFVGTVVYVTPIWVVFLSRKLHGWARPKLEGLEAGAKKRWQRIKKSSKDVRDCSEKAVKGHYFYGNHIPYSYQSIGWSFEHIEDVTI